MFSPNKEAELAFRQQLDSISVRNKKKCIILNTNHTKTKSVYLPGEYEQMLMFWGFFCADAVRSFPLQTEKTSKQTTSETTCSSGNRGQKSVLALSILWYPSQGNVGWS